MATAFSGTWLVDPHVPGGFGIKWGVARLTMPSSATIGSTGEDIATALSFTDHFDAVFGVFPGAGTGTTPYAYLFGLQGTSATAGGVTAGKLQAYWSADGTDGEVLKELGATTDLTTTVATIDVLVLGYKV